MQLNIHNPSYEASLVFDQVDPSVIRNSIKEVGKALDLDTERAYFRYIILSNNDGTGKFERTTKEIRPDETDQRKKLIVMGLTEAEGKIQSLISDISAKKYSCKIQEITSRTVICSAMQ